MAVRQYLAPGSVCCALIPFNIMSDGGRTRSPLTTLPDARSRSAGIGFMKMGEPFMQQPTLSLS
jgi:hypothetical protein